MSQNLPLVYLARHGETLWTKTGQHTGRTDIALTERGEQNARRLADRLKDVTFSLVLTSPLQRARRTCELAGYAPRAQVADDLQEWDYGDYEGRISADIHKERPYWYLFRDGCPHGETADQVGVRADRVIARIRQQDGNALLFAHGHFLRVFAARWLALPACDARYFLLGTAALSILGYEHGRVEEPAIRLWNDDRHVVPAP